MSGLILMPGLQEGWHLGSLYPLALAAIGVVVLGGVVAMMNRRARVVPASVVYVSFGALGAVALSLLDVAPLDPESDHLVVERLTELALIVAVFAAGLTIERRVRRGSWISIATLLIVVMPLTILIIALFGMWAMGLSFAAALLLGAVLAPTDPVLAGDVGLSGVGGEVYGEPRLSLHTEAGFNDGLASPFVALGLYVATHGGSGWVGAWLTADLLYAAGAALAFGAIAGHAAAALMTRASERRALSGDLYGLATVGVVLVIYGITEALGGYGLLAVFAAGFTFRRYEFDHAVHHSVHQGSEMSGRVLELLVLLLLGTMLTTAGLRAPGVAGWLLVPFLLLAVRPALVLATISPGVMSRRSRLFLGFFGVRGVAALFYAAVVVDSHALDPQEQHVLVWTTIACVVASIVVHGVSATPLTNRWLR
jgi:NhaP-type Na+/H+ or K+/H+ antiporter